MPSESDLRADLRKLIVRDLHGHVSNLEDKFTSGVADTSFAFDFSCSGATGYSHSRFIRGWIELKYVRNLPKLYSTRVRIGIRKEQRIWLKERWRAGRDSMILARIIDDIYLFSGEDTEELYKGATMSRIEKMWYGKWRLKIDVKELVQAICEIIQ